MTHMLTTEETRKIVTAYARESEHNLTIIFGAGASYGYSREGARLAPPIVRNLFDESESHIVAEVINKAEHRSVKSQQRQIAKKIAQFKGDLEAYLSDQYLHDAEDPLFPAILRYLEDIFAHVSANADLDFNNYQSLVSSIREFRGAKNWSLITFNYDTLLEQSIMAVPRFTKVRKFQTDADYTGAVNPKLLKMHGGVSHRYIKILDPVVDGRPSHYEIFTEMMTNGSSVENYLDFSAVGSSLPGYIDSRNFEGLGRRPICNFPLMMIPVHAECRTGNSFFNRQIDLAVEEISKSKLIVAIGYQFGDKSFLQELKKLNLSDSQLILVGGGTLQRDTVQSDMYVNASQVWRDGNISIFEGGGFEEFAESV